MENEGNNVDASFTSFIPSTGDIVRYWNCLGLGDFVFQYVEVSTNSLVVGRMNSHQLSDNGGGVTICSFFYIMVEIAVNTYVFTAISPDDKMCWCSRRY